MQKVTRQLAPGCLWLRLGRRGRPPSSPGPPGHHAAGSHAGHTQTRRRTHPVRAAATMKSSLLRASDSPRPAARNARGIGNRARPQCNTPTTPSMHQMDVLKPKRAHQAKARRSVWECPPKPVVGNSGGEESILSTTRNGFKTELGRRRVHSTRQRWQDKGGRAAQQSFEPSLASSGWGWP